MLGPNTHSKVEINKLNDKQFKTKSKRSLITSKTNDINKQYERNVTKIKCIINCDNENNLIIKYSRLTRYQNE